MPLRQRVEVEALPRSPISPQGVVLAPVDGGEAVPGGPWSPEGKSSRDARPAQTGGPETTRDQHKKRKSPSPRIPVPVVLKKARKLLEMIDLIPVTTATETAWERAHQWCAEFQGDMEWLLNGGNLGHNTPVLVAPAISFPAHKALFDKPYNVQQRICCVKSSRVVFRGMGFDMGQRSPESPL